MSGQLPNGKYVIESVLRGGQVLEVEGEIANDGTRVDLWQDNNKPHQRWQLTEVTDDSGDSFYTIGHPGSPMVMEAPGPWQRGDPIVMRDYERDGGDRTHRHWKLISGPGHLQYYKIMNRRSGLVIDVEGGISGTGQIKQYESWDAPDMRQYWDISPSSQ